MHRLSAPSAPLVVFLAAMVGGSSVLYLGIIVLGVCLLAFLPLVFTLFPEKFRWQVLASASSYSDLDDSRAAVVASAKDVAKCSTECFIVGGWVAIQ